MAVPAIVSKLAGLAAGVSLAAGALAIADGVLGSAFNPTLDNNYTINSLTQFPSDLPQISGQMYTMLFQFYKYDRPSILQAPTLIPYGGIALPLPANLIDKSAQNYSEESGFSVANALLENMPRGSTFASVSEGLAGISTAAGAVASASGISAINNVATSIAGAQALNKALAFSGVVQNPFLSVLFNSPSFKRHAFTWTFIPETAQNTENLNFILNKFRYHSMPDLNAAPGGLLLNYPDMCIPTLVPQGYMYDFKQCVIESMSINYAPGDTPAFNTKQAPNAIQFSISLLEIEYWIKSDLLSASKNFGTNTAANALFGQAPYGSAA